VLQWTMYDSGRFMQMVLRVLQDRKDTMSALVFVLQPGPDLTSQAPALYLHLDCVRESPAACARPGRSMRPPAESGVAVWVRSQYGRRLSARRLLSRSLPFSMGTIRTQSERFQSTVRVHPEYVIYNSSVPSQFKRINISNIYFLDCDQEELL
jgi:hypothetical protein